MYRGATICSYRTVIALYEGWEFSGMCLTNRDITSKRRMSSGRASTQQPLNQAPLFT